MFTADLIELKATQTELQRQAEHYRLLKSIRQASPLASRIAGAVGRMLVSSGQQLAGQAGQQPG